MDHTLTISDRLYARLEAAARAHGLQRVEQLLEHWQSNDEEVRRRQEVVHEIDGLRNGLFARYGEMPGSVELVRADRDR